MWLNGKNLFKLLAVVALIMCLPLAQAGSDEDKDKHESEDQGKEVWFLLDNAKYLQECASCHVPYPPGMLSTESWRKIMEGLSEHFGTDASLSAKDTEEITAYLQENSTDYWIAEVAPLRITETDWFQRAHNFYVIPPGIWKSPAVKSPANCAACHAKAEHGDYSEKYIKLPKFDDADK